MVVTENSNATYVYGLRLLASSLEELQKILVRIPVLLSLIKSYPSGFLKVSKVIPFPSLWLTTYDLFVDG